MTKTSPIFSVKWLIESVSVALLFYIICISIQCIFVVAVVSDSCWYKAMNVINLPNNTSFVCVFVWMTCSLSGCYKAQTPVWLHHRLWKNEPNLLFLSFGLIGHVWSFVVGLIFAKINIKNNIWLPTFVFTIWRHCCTVLTFDERFITHYTVM